MTAGISNDPTMAVATTVNNEAQYSAGRGAGSALKYAVKLPKRFTVRFAAGSVGLRLKVSRRAVQGEPEVALILSFQISEYFPATFHVSLDFRIPLAIQYS